MLSLTRYPGEWIEIAHRGERLRIQVNRVEGRRVYLAFDAPQSFQINRQEVIEERERAQIAADLAELQRGKPHTF